MTLPVRKFDAIVVGAGGAGMRGRPTAENLTSPLSTFAT